MRKMRQMKKLKANGGGMYFLNYKNLKINGEYYLTQIKKKYLAYYLKMMKTQKHY